MSIKLAYYNFFYILVAEISSVGVMSGEVTMDRGGGAEDHIGTQVVLPVTAKVTVAARYSGLNGYAIPHFQARYAGAQLKVIKILEF